MPTVHFEDILPYKAQDLYALVMDIEKYPEIFDDIDSVTVRDKGENVKDVDVSVIAPFKNFTYSCDVEGTPPSKIAIAATKGAFKQMNAEWSFEPTADGKTRVKYNMDFDFGGIGFMNAVAVGFIQQSVDKTKQHLIRYAAQNLRLVSVPPPQEAPPGP